MNERTARVAVYNRSQGLCEVGVPGYCIGVGQSVHHRKNRSQGGTWDVVNLLHTCGDGVRHCHGWITAHPKAAHRAGWAVKSYEDPADHAVKMHGRFVLLTADGRYEDLPEEAD
ncbi:HNH endonuclease [Rhodococcus sp. MALMAid1271]|uniref:HNH endonuclease n=1 Tax=Rhodococcus sp. MALMAid1271 TaxID=3411744 RepID=UPI003BA38516